MPVSVMRGASATKATPKSDRCALPVAVEEDVAGRHVAVQDARPVHVTERVGHRRHGQQRLGDRERAVGETVGQVAALEQRHHHERPAVHAADVVDGHEVRVVHRRGERDLALDARVVGHREDLHGGVAVEEEIVGSVDLGARAPTDQLAEGEALTETLGEGSRRRRGRRRIRLVHRPPPALDSESHPSTTHTRIGPHRHTESTNSGDRGHPVARPSPADHSLRVTRPARVSVER